MSSGWATLRSAIVREMRRTAVVVDVAARHRRLGPAGSDRVDPRPRRDARDLVLQRQQQPALEGRLRRRVVGVPRLAEPARGRADEHERAVARAGDLAQERPRGEERGGEVLADRLLPARERELPHRQVDGRPDAGDRGAHVDRAELLARDCEQPVDVVLDRQVGLGDRRAADLGRDRCRPLLAAVVVHEHLRALGGEEPRAGGADPAGGTGDDDALCLRDPFPRGRRLSAVKVFIVSDLEGVSGVTNPGQTIGGSPMYEESRRLYTEEMNAAVRGAKAAGATEIVVMDCHGAGEEWDFNSLIPELLDEACDFVVQDSWTEYTAFLESGVDAALFVGMHATGGHAPRGDEPHGLGPGVAEPLVQRRPRRRDRDQRGALRQLGLPGADGHG